MPPTCRAPVLLWETNAPGLDRWVAGDGHPTYGFLSQISPDGRYVLSTVKDLSVFVPRPEWPSRHFSFRSRGSLRCMTARRSSSLRSQGGRSGVGAEQSDLESGRAMVVVARTQASELEKPLDRGRVLLTFEECRELLERGKTFGPF